MSQVRATDEATARVAIRAAIRSVIGNLQEAITTLEAADELTTQLPEISGVVHDALVDLQRELQAAEREHRPPRALRLVPAQS